MPIHRAYFATRDEAEAARVAAVAAIEARYTEANANDPLVAAGSVAGSPAPTARFEYVSAEDPPAGALPTGVAAMRKVRVLVTTVDGRPAYSTIWMAAADATALATAGAEYHAVGAPIEWRTDMHREADGRWSVTLWSTGGV